MQRRRRSVLLGIVLGITAGGLWLPATGAEVGLQLSLDSAYVYRGISQSDNGLSGQVGIRLQNDNGIFVGAQTSRVNYPRPTDDRSLETVLFAGIHKRHNEDLAYGGAIVYRAYNHDRPIDYNWGELQLTMQWRDHWTALYAYSDDWYGLGGSSHTTELTYRYAFPMAISADITAGFSSIDGPIVDQYAYGDAGIAWAREGLLVRMAYTATNNGADNFGRSADSRWSVRVAWRHSWR